MAEIETYRKKPVEVEMMLWDGTHARAQELAAWTGYRQVEIGGWGTPRELIDGPAIFALPGTTGHARLWVAHNESWSPLPVGYRVAKELDGSGFYPLSPEGFEAGYVTSVVSE